MQLQSNTLPDTATETSAGHPGSQRGARQAQRMPQTRSANIIISAPGGVRTPRTVDVTDVSLNGIAFRTEKPVLQHTPFLLPRHSARSALAYTVVHCRQEQQHFVVGAELNGAVDLKPGRGSPKTGKLGAINPQPTLARLTSRMFGKLKRRLRPADEINFVPGLIGW